MTLARRAGAVARAACFWVGVSAGRLALVRARVRPDEVVVGTSQSGNPMCIREPEASVRVAALMSWASASPVGLVRLRVNPNGLKGFEGDLNLF